MQPVPNVTNIPGMHTAASLHEQTGQRFLPLDPTLRMLMPQGGLRRGSVVNVAAGVPGSTSLLLAMMAEASRSGSWCAVVGLPGLGYVAAAEYGIVLARLAIVPQPGSQWAQVCAALIDGFDIVTISVPEPLPAAAQQQFAARARRTGTTIFPFGHGWDVAETSIRVVSSEWHGIGEGAGRRVLVEGRRRNVHDQGRRIDLWLPKPDQGRGTVGQEPRLRLVG